jgi:hypothetical protein
LKDITVEKAGFDFEEFGEHVFVSTGVRSKENYAEVNY